jgi:Mg-chelatase subunit ChlD
MRLTRIWLTLFALAACGDDDSLTGEASSTSTAAGPSSSKPARADAGRAGSGTKTADAGQARAPVPRSDAGGGAAELCDSIKIQSGRVVPDMLIVLDRSTSMKNFMVNRWDPSVSGIKAITSALDQTVRFGLLAFPGSGGATGGGGRACAPGSVEVPIGLKASAAIAQRLDQLELVESTPTAAALEVAQQTLQKLEASADGVTPKRYVVLVTDGAPNCTGGTLGGGGRGNDQTAVNDSVAAIQAMAKNDIKTYVVGYDTQAEAELKGALDMMAKAGATGDTEHRAIEDEQGLIAAFTEITKTASSCDYALDQAPADPSFVKVQIGTKLIRYDDPDGWVLSTDKRTLSLQGAACAALATATVETLSVEVQCEEVQYL